jgi:hypothetical protein
VELEEDKSSPPLLLIRVESHCPATALAIESDKIYHPFDVFPSSLLQLVFNSLTPLQFIALVLKRRIQNPEQTHNRVNAEIQTYKWVNSEKSHGILATL